MEDLGDGAFYGQNPTYGAAFNYYLAKSVKRPGELIITNSSGKVVRTLRGLHEGKPETMTPAEPTDGNTRRSANASKADAKVDASGGGANSANQKKVPWVPTQAGLHRIYWNLRSQGPVRWKTDLKFQKGPRSGALLPPGVYTATLKIGDLTAKQNFNVVNDPTSQGRPIVMQQEYQLSEEVLHELSQLDVALNRLQSIDAQAKALRAAAIGTANEKIVDEEVKSLEQSAKVVKLEITSNAGAEESTLRVPDRIREHLQMLAYLIGSSDDAPTAAMLRIKTIYDREYRAAISDYDNFLSTKVATFNQVMTSRNLTGVIRGTTLTP